MSAKGWAQLGRMREIGRARSHRQGKEFGFLSFSSNEKTMEGFKQSHVIPV